MSSQNAPRVTPKKKAAKSDAAEISKRSQESFRRWVAAQGPDENKDLPPFIIVHMMRHASSVSNTPESGLTDRGQRQCDDFAQQFRKHAPFITHILSSPWQRAQETASRALAPAIQKGVRIQLMPALHGRPYEYYLDAITDGKYSGSWTTQGPGLWEATMSPTEYVTRWFSLQGLECFRRPGEASRVREVVVVTHEQFLMDFFGHDFYSLTFGNVVMTSFVATRDQKLKSIDNNKLSVMRDTLKTWDEQQHKERYKTLCAQWKSSIDGKSTQAAFTAKVILEWEKRKQDLKMKQQNATKGEVGKIEVTLGKF